MIAAAMLTNILIAGFAGVMVPLTLERMGLTSPAVYAAGYSISATTQAVIGESRTLAYVAGASGTVRRIWMTFPDRSPRIIGRRCAPTRKRD